MAAIDFPNSPAANQIFVAPNGVTYQWTGTLWLPIGGTQALYVGDTPLASPGPNQLWWNSASGQMYLWYNDGNSTQWVPTTPTLPVGVPAPLGFRQFASVATVAQPTVDIQNIPADINHLQFNFDLTPTVNDVDIILQFYDASGVLVAGAGYLWSTALNWSTAGAGAASQQTSSSSYGYAGGIIMNYAAAGGRVSSGVGNSIAGTAFIRNIRDTTKTKQANFNASSIAGNGSYLSGINGGGSRNAAGSMTGFRLSFNGGSNVAAGGNVTAWGSP